MPFSHIKAFLTKLTEAQTPHSSDWVTSSNVGNKRALDTCMVGPITAFGEMSVAELTPIVQIDALYGLRAEDVQTTVGPSGTATTKTDHGGREFEVTSGTNAAGFGRINSKHIVRYRAGQGLKLRITARFDTAQASSSQRAGGFNLGSELSFGFNGTSFGILHRTGGRPEIQTLTVNIAAAGAETLTLTLDGADFTIPLTVGTTQHNAFEIAGSAEFAADWVATQNDSTVVFIAKAVGDKVGAFTFASSGAATGTFVEDQAGIAVTDTFIAQTTWNLTTLLTATDPFILDPSQGNVYEIQLQYLGFGSLTFGVEDPNSGRFIAVHQIQFANNNVVPSLETPIFKLFWEALNTGNTTSLTVNGASAAGFIEGILIKTRNPVAHNTSKTGIGTTLTNIFSIRNRCEFKSFENLTQVFPDVAFIATEGTKTAAAEIHINASITGETNWQYHDQAESIVEFDESNTTISGNTQVATVSLGKTDSQSINLKDLGIKLEPGDTLTIAVRTTAGTTEINGSATWTED